jgi:hypothetical protein
MKKLFVGILIGGILFYLDSHCKAETECRGQQILKSRECAGDGLEPEESKLHQLVNQYRIQNGLPRIPLSKSLTLVANRHARDLAENIGFLTHGWSDCSYDPGQSHTWSCMWNAPQRLGTKYPGRGYENGYGSSQGHVTAASALESWKKSTLHNAVILNRGIWRNHHWKALGVGIYKGFCVLWFGEEADLHAAGSEREASEVLLAFSPSFSIPEDNPGNDSEMEPPVEN